ncbi:MAG: hypothetical protein EOP46_10535 [Sphingobacteriaceae bacterium]|nr:MAG: hypothetical protein EOP46_10535 [Sphingobacteriaceae bacterium]
MKKALSLIVFSISLLFISNSLKAQDYQTAVGLKFGGYENGVSAKYFFQPNTALEGIIGIRRGGVVVTGLYEIHAPAFNVDKFKFYYGFGAHIGGVGKGKYQRFGGDDEFYTKSQILAGVDGVLGLEYIIPDSPIGISLDLNPRLELNGPFFDLAPGLGLKYTF